MVPGGEGLNKESPEANGISIGEFTCGLARDHIEARVPGKVEVNGKDGPDTIHELTGMRIP